MNRIRFALLFALASGPASAATPPNVVFLLVDDLGWGDFGSYGATFYETPNIDRLSREGMRFTNAYAACTVCSPSRAAILSGRYPARLRLTDWIPGHPRPWEKLAVPDWQMSLDHERVLLPEALQEAGYATGFFGKWHLMPEGDPTVAQHYPTDHGFDLNVGGREWGQPKGPGKYFAPFGMPNLPDGEPGDYLTDKLTDAAVAWMDERPADQPFLLYLSYYTVHGPLMAPSSLVDKYTAKAATFANTKDEFLDPRRAGMVESLDQSVGRLMAYLDSRGLAENTVIILTGDNGGDYNRTTGGLRGYKAFSHEGGTRVPLVVRWPGRIAPQSESAEPVIGTDFYPTILAMAGLPGRPTEHVDGANLLPLLQGEVGTLSRGAVYWHYPHYHRTAPYGAVRRGDWKLIEFYEDGALELYNLAQDPTETTNLAATEPDRAQILRADLQAWLRSVDAQMPTPNPHYDPTRVGQHGRLHDSL